MRVLLVLAVCLVQLRLVGSQVITCTSNQPDTNCTASNSCGDEHPPEGTRYDQYIDDTCDPGFSSRTYSMPRELERQLCPNYVSCDVAADNEESTRYEGRPEVNVRVETASLYQFDVHISWEHNPVTSRERRRGYQVRVHNEYGLVECFCVNDRDARNLTITGSSYLHFGNIENMIVEVAPYPLPNHRDFVSSITGQYSSSWPSSCLDLGTHNCYPPTYPSPSNIRLHTSLHNETVQAMRLEITWDAATPLSSWNSSGDQLTYYIQLEHLQPFPDDDPLVVSDYFRVTNTGETGRLSVSLYPLNVSVLYTQVRLLTHYPCSGLATVKTNNIGCGKPSTAHSISPPMLLSTATVSSSSPSSTKYTSPLLPPVTTATPSLPSTEFVQPPSPLSTANVLCTAYVQSASVSSPSPAAPAEPARQALTISVVATVTLILILAIIAVVIAVIVLMVCQYRRETVYECHVGHAPEKNLAPTDSQIGDTGHFSKT